MMASSNRANFVKSPLVRYENSKDQQHPEGKVLKWNQDKDYKKNSARKLILVSRTVCKFQ
jgi:hypothetical protein